MRNTCVKSRVIDVAHTNNFIFICIALFIQVLTAHSCYTAHLLCLSVVCLFYPIKQMILKAWSIQILLTWSCIPWKRHSNNIQWMCRKWPKSLWYSYWKRLLSCKPENFTVNSFCASQFYWYYYHCDPEMYGLRS